MKQTTLISRFGNWTFCCAMLLSAAGVEAAGLLQPSDGSLPALEIRDHRVDVVIEDSYAVTTVEQVFHNPHARDLEAVYSFPVPEKGAVAEFTLWIDGKPVTGEVLEREEAKRVYAEEKAAGRDAGITEQDGYKTFDTRVYPVRAGQETRTRMVYLQPVHVDTGIGRYLYPLEEGGVDEEKLAFWAANEKVTGNFSFDLRLRSAYPLDAVRMPDHPQAQITRLSDGEWHLHLSRQGGMQQTPVNGDQALPVQPATPAAAAAGFSPAGNGPAFTLDRDLVVYWRHRDGLPGSVDLVAHKPADSERGTFMLVVTPGDDLKPIQEGKDWVFVLDMSGSMQGKYATLADGVQRALGRMRPNDRFRIVLFNDTSRELTQGFVAATADAVARYSGKVAAITPGGSTNLYAGIEEGLQSMDADRTSALILVTDGVANVGELEQQKFIELIKRKDIRLFTFIMGNSANRPLLETLTRESSGFAASVSNSDDIVGQLLSATAKVTHEALHGVKVDIDGVKTAELAPKTIGSLYHGQQLVLFGHYWGDGMADVSLSGRISGTPKQYRTRFPFPGKAVGNPEIERLWAFASIEEQMQEIGDFGENPDLRQSVVDLALEYGLVTDYTAMVVMRDDVFEQRGIERTNRSRLAVEQAAREQRAQRTAVSRRVDTAQPMYSGTRPGHSGGGALDPWSLLMLLPLSGWLLYRRIRGEC